MAQLDANALVLGLQQTMENLNVAISTQSMGNFVEKYDGSDPKEFKAWIRSVEKYALLNSLDDRRKIHTAFMSSTRQLSEYLFRWTTDTAPEEQTWERLKRDLTLRFSLVTDAEHARSLLKKIKQGPNRTVQMFAEEIHSLAELTFSGLTGAGARAAIESQLISTFVDGLNSDSIRMKLMRDTPATFERAVKIAMDEQNLRKRFNVRTGHAEEYQGPRSVPMEIDHARPRIRCHICNRVGHRARDCRQRQINEVSNGFISNRQGNEMKRIGGTDRNPQNSNGRSTIICWHCQKPGHTRRFCELLKRTQPQGYQGQRPQYQRQGQQEN